MTFDKENIYDEQISPLMAQIVAICKEHKIPLCSTFQYSDNGSGPAYCTTILLFEGIASEHMIYVSQVIKPKPVCIAETHITHENGGKTISMRQV